MTKPDYNQESRNLKLAVLAERDNVKELLDFFEYCLDDADGSQRTYLGPRGIVCRFKRINRKHTSSAHELAFFDRSHAQ